MNKEESFVKHFVIIAFGSFLNLLIGLFTTPIITRLVDPEQYGQLSIFNLYINISVMIFCLGLDQAIVRFYYTKEEPEYHSSIAHVCIKIPLVSWIVFSVLILSLNMAGIIKFEFTGTILYLLLLCVSFQLASRITNMVLRLEYKSKAYSLVSIIQKLTYTVLALILIVNIPGKDLLILVIATTVASFIALITSIAITRNIWFINRKGKKASFSLDNTKELIKYGLPFILTMGITTLFQSIDKLSLNHFCEYTEVGIYTSAMSLVNLCVIIQSSFNTIWVPKATEHYEKNKDDKEFYSKANSYITVVMFSAGLCLILFKDLFAYLLGENYRQAAFILPCLAFNPMMYTISETTVCGINFAKKSQYHIWISALSCGVNLAGNTILVPLIGGRGAAISTGVSYIVFFVLRTYFSNRCFKVEYQLIKISIVTALTFIFALYSTFSFTNWVSLVLFIVCEGTLIAIYKKEVFKLITVLIEKIKGYSKSICNRGKL